MSSLWPPQRDPGCSYISAPPAEAYSKKHVRNLAILGSTGSIGRSALKVAETSYPLKIRALAGGSNIKLLAEQASRWRPDYLAVLNSDAAQQLESCLPSDYRPIIFWGQNGYATMASLPEIDCVLAAQSGFAGLPGTLAAAMAGKVIALANKESLVLAGSLLRQLCSQTGASILPVDSEHYAIFQCAAGRGAEIKSLVLTASGGPFLGKSRSEIANATPSQALKHPNWNMGSKISVDSATLMNKGLEMIEAIHLFGVSSEKIRILIQPQSVVHSLVELADNSLLAQLAVADMRLSIGGCLLWPYAAQNCVASLDLANIHTLDFLEPDLETFAALKLARRAADFSLTPEWIKIKFNPACIVLNGANEAAVEMFLSGLIPFGDIVPRVELAMNALLQNPVLPEYRELEGLSPSEGAMTLMDMIAPLDAMAREFVEVGVNKHPA